MNGEGNRDGMGHWDKNGNIDYRLLFEKERQEREECQAQLAQLEEQRRLLEANLKRFLDLKKELSSFQREAEESDRVVNDFIKAVVPDFTTKSHQVQEEVYRAKP